MFSTSKVGLVISFIILTVGSLVILFISFLNTVFKLLLIVSLLLIIQIVTYINFRKSLTRYLKLYNNCNFIELVNDLERKHNKVNTFIIKSLYDEYLLICYSYLHEFDKMKPLVNRIEDEYSKMNDSIKKIDYNFYLFVYYIGLNNYDKVLKLRNEMRILLQTINIDSKKSEKQRCLLNYYNMNYRIALIEEKTDKKILQKAEEYYLNGFNNESLLFKVSSANRLVTVYEKLGNKEKAKEYASFVIKNHKDFFIDPERISKYSKK